MDDNIEMQHLSDVQINLAGGLFNLSKEYRRLARFSEVRRCLACPDSELDTDFLGFLDDYRDLAGRLPRGMTVVDLGCNQAIQAVYFEDRPYIGVDTIPKGLRYQAKAVTHVRGTIQDFCTQSTGRPRFDIADSFAFCCNVPDHDGVWDMVRKTFRYYRISYPYTDTPRGRFIEEKLPGGHGDE